jgi:hypothetical protein
MTDRTKDRLARDLRAVAETAPWQPAATAPKDGTQILAWWPQFREYGVVRWSDEEGSWLEGAAERPDPVFYWIAEK